ncbi:MAG: preprotein translocase subunit SecG [Cryomorphaceae bacterium]|nr:preprotein translocase subunit SecG [Flavobacteriales bacterium]
MLLFIYAMTILICVFLALIVLVQNPKGGGLDSSFSSANQIGGVKRTGDFLERSTWTLGVVLFILCLVSAGIHDQDVVAAPMFEETMPEMPEQMPGGEELPSEEAAPGTEPTPEQD